MRISVGDVTLNYEVLGQGPPIVLTHGLGGTLKNWEETAHELSDAVPRVHRDGSTRVLARIDGDCQVIVAT